MTTPSATGTAQVRRVQEREWAQLRTARLAALAEAPYAFSSTLAHEQEFGEDTWRTRTQTAATFGAWAGADIVGLATAGLDSAEPGWGLFGMWVSPAWRGTGVAGRLVEAACQHARDLGADRISLWVTEVNARAMAFYRRLGFEPTAGRQLVRPDEPDHWEVELARQL